MITIEIDTGNDAFVGDPATEVTRILGGLVSRILADGLPPVGEAYWLKDYNGNTVGHLGHLGYKS